MRCGILVLLAVLGAALAAQSSSKKVVCYFGSWAVTRPGKGKFEIKNIQPKLCTHFIYGFVGITPDGGIKILDKKTDITNGGFKKFNALRKGNPKVKTLVAVGGWSEGSEKFSKVMNDAKKRSAFVKNAVKFVKQYGFNGFDLDWEYPASRGGVASDKKAFVSLLKALHTEFKKHKLLLSAAVGASKNLVGTSYDVPALSKYLDFINLMTYDMHGSWDKKTGHNAPLYPDVDASVKHWIKNGASRGKIVLGMGIYGRSFTLKSASSAGLGAPITGPGKAGPYSGEKGTIGYNEICEMEKKGGWKVMWDDKHKVPYARSGNQWVGYDNVKSIKLKAEYARKMGLEGAMVWSLDTDDFLGKCHGNKFPLLSEINKVLRK